MEEGREGDVITNQWSVTERVWLGVIIIIIIIIIIDVRFLYNRKVPGKETQPLIIGNNNLFEFHSRCESLSVGSENIFEPKCKQYDTHSPTQYKQQCVIVTVGVVGPNIVVSDYCVIGAECSVLSNEGLPPGTVISGKDCRRWNKQVNIKVRERGEERGIVIL